LDELREVDSDHALYDEEGPALLVAVEVEDPDEVRVREPCGELGLVEEHSHLMRRGLQPGEASLHRDRPWEPLGPEEQRLVDLSRPACAEAAYEAVAPGLLGGWC